MYLGPSFKTIAGHREQGAIIHYAATPETDIRIEPEGILIVDCGGQYLDGTTDITRAVALSGPDGLALVDPGLLEEAEIAWINDYHSMVRGSLSPRLDPPDRDWLIEATGRI